MANEAELEKIAKPVFGITSRRYRQMANDEIVPAVVKGKIDFVAASKALIDYYRKLAEGSGSLSLTEERRLKVQVDRKLKEVEYLVETKELIRREEVLGEFLWRINAVTQGLMSLHRHLSPQLVGKDAREISDIIKKYTYQLRERFSRKSGILRDVVGKKKRLVARGNRSVETTKGDDSE